MKIIAIETSSEACSAALLIDGETRSQFQLAPRMHTELLLGMVDQLLAEAQLVVGELDAIAYGRGPGAFTGLRIACGVAQGVAFAADLPQIGVSSLAAMAQGAWRRWSANSVVVAVDARMNEIYCGCYQLNDAQQMVEVIEESVVSPTLALLPEGEGWLAVGSGWRCYRAELESRMVGRLSGIEEDHLPHAEDVALLAGQVLTAGECPNDLALPRYLRNRVVG